MNAKTNILLVSPFFFPTNRYQQELCSKLKNLYPEISISILCYKTIEKVPEKFADLDVYQVPCSTLIKGQFVLPNYLILIKTLIKLKKDKKIKLLMCETRFFDSSWWIPIVAKIWKIPAILIDHCASVPRHNLFLIRFALKTFDKFIAPIILNSYSVVACSNKAVFDYLKSLGVKNLKLIGTGVDANFFNPDKRSRSNELSSVGVRLNENDLLITFASRLIYTKGVELFYEAVRPLIVRYSNLKVVIGGEGPLYEKINKKVLLEKMRSRVFLTGLLSVDQLSLLLARTDIFVHPSFHHDGIPNVVLEAGESSCLVIASSSGGTDEVIKNNETGILIKNLSEKTIRMAIEEGITDKSKRLTLGKALRLMLIREYSWEKVGKSIRELINQLVPQL